MDTEDFVRIADDLEFILEDIDDLTQPLDLTPREKHRLAEAGTHIENARAILVNLFPAIRSLDPDTRADLKAEFAS
jgi:hypothetical protein